jgi:hypothetical protein
MTVDLHHWRKMLEDVVESIADEGLQRRAWLGADPEVWSPDEAFCQFFDDADDDDFLGRDDTGLSKRQIKAGLELAALMRALSDATPDHTKPADLTDDPCWRKIRRVAARFHRLLTTGHMAA